MQPSDSGPAARPRHPGQVLVAIGVSLLGIALAYGTSTLPDVGGYAKVGPRLMPAIVSGGLILLGLVLLKEALTAGFRDVDEAAHVGTPTDWRAFAWISGGLLLDGLLIVPAGFIIAGTALFVLAARGFGSAAWLRNGITGLVISVATYVFFTYGLGLALPRGILPY